MNRISKIGFAVAVCMSLAAGSGSTFASERQAADKTVAANAGATSKPVRSAPKTVHRDPMQASASYTGGARSVAPQTSTVSNRYDGGCRARYRAGSTEYGACLQDIPAAALVGGGIR